MRRPEDGQHWISDNDLQEGRTLQLSPVAFYYSDLRVYFVTPVSAAKYKMIKENPRVSLIVDNKQLTTNACGAMIQGRARTFSITRTLLSILSLGPNVAGFSKKYPGMLQ
ncbi:pyridoxamine 5'-phosphate oxidase family protein [Candidatus Bathyarchaeota archaeon]|nr:MAG: pyridoxamine 5'-phosphate oxidase family protein [Candidatus Bathyarchaeota archaeon]